MREAPGRAHHGRVPARRRVPEGPLAARPVRHYVRPGFVKRLPLSGQRAPVSEFMALTKIPIIIYYGENIAAEPTANPGQDGWRVRLAMARLLKGCCEPGATTSPSFICRKIGIRGNAHFQMSDMNTLQIVDQLPKFVSKKKLDRSAFSPQWSVSLFVSVFSSHMTEINPSWRNSCNHRK